MTKQGIFSDYIGVMLVFFLIIAKRYSMPRSIKRQRKSSWLRKTIETGDNLQNYFPFQQFIVIIIFIFGVERKMKAILREKYTLF